MKSNFESTIETLVNVTKDIAGKAAVKAGEAMNVSKSYVDKAQLKYKLDDKFKELGKLCYSMHKNGTDEAGNMKIIIKEIKSIESQLEMTDETAGKSKVCRFCGAKNPADNTFCSKCGEKMNGF